MLEARNVAISLSGRRIVHGVDLSARAGEVTVLVGPNGSGKTTLFRALSGDIPYTGTITLGGTDLRALSSPALAIRRAVLPQSSSLPFPFTVREVVALGARAGRSGLDAADLDALPEAALERVDLAGFAGRFYGELSGGEQQRVQLARVLCQVWLPVIDGAPRFLMLDEPVSSLDIRHQITIMEIARDFARQGGGVIAILHDLNLAALYADAVHAVDAGHVVRSGTPAGVIDDLLLAEVFGCPLPVGLLAGSNLPFVLPQQLRRTA